MISWNLFGPRQANLVLIAYASSEGSGEPAHPRSLARTFAARSYKQWVKRNLQTESQIPGSSEWLDMRSWNLSWRNARRHKFAWRGSFELEPLVYLLEMRSSLPDEHFWIHSVNFDKSYGPFPKWASSKIGIISRLSSGASVCWGHSVSDTAALDFRLILTVSYMP